MNVDTFADRILWPGLKVVEQICNIPVTLEAGQFITAICKQESDLAWRYQRLLGDTAGPARGWAQFEQAGVNGVINHRKTGDLAAALCEHYHVVFRIDHVWRAMEGHDGLAIGFARLLVYSDIAPLPTEEETGWNYYYRNWRPGKPDRSRWAVSSWRTGQSVRIPEWHVMTTST